MRKCHAADEFRAAFDASLELRHRKLKLEELKGIQLLRMQIRKAKIPSSLVIGKARYRGLVNGLVEAKAKYHKKDQNRRVQRHFTFSCIQGLSVRSAK